MELHVTPNLQEETMKRAFLTFVMAVMLTASLAACGNTPAGTNGSGTDTNTARNRMGGSTAMDNRGRYYADDNGDVYGGNDGIGNDIGRAAGDVMNGMDDAIQDMTR